MQRGGGYVKELKDYDTEELLKMSALIDCGLQRALIPETMKNIRYLLEIERELTRRET